LGEVRAAPGSTVKVLAERAGLHVNTAREHLQALQDEGLIAAEPKPIGTRGRPPAIYRPVDDPALNAAARRRVERARENGELLRQMLPEADRTEGLSEAAVHQLDTLYEHLDDAGLEPDLDESSLKADITPCPYYRIVGEDQELACAVHARILRDTLALVPGPLKLRELRPYAGPEHCVVQLYDASASEPE